MSSHRLVARTVVLALMVSACVPSGPSQDTTATTTPTAEILSDSAIKSLIIVNIKNNPDATSAIPLDATRAPNIMVRDGVLMVATTDPQSAVSLCQTIAGMTNSPDTKAPLGITEVVIIAPGRQPIASCHP